jgi:hypothetical protein
MCVRVVGLRSVGVRPADLRDDLVDAVVVLEDMFDLLE